MARGTIDSTGTHVLPLELGRGYPVIVRGEGVWVEDSAGRRYLDAMSGGSMAATLGHGRTDIIAAARAQAERLAYVHNERLTNPAQERLAEELVQVAPEGFTRARFVTSGSDANEMAVQLARSYHVERGEPDRWQVLLDFNFDNRHIRLFVDTDDTPAKLFTRLQADSDARCALYDMLVGENVAFRINDKAAAYTTCWPAQLATKHIQKRFG